MPRISTTDARFLNTLETWMSARSEILVLIRYSHAAGNREFEFFSSFQSLLERLRELPPSTSVIAFKQLQLPHRGVVDDYFIAECLNRLPDGVEYLITETKKVVYGRMSWFRNNSGVTHAELRDDLEESRGSSVAAGLYPQWLVDNDDVISAIVPDEQGVVTPGVY